MKSPTRGNWNKFYAEKTLVGLEMEFIFALVIEEF